MSSTRCAVCKYFRRRCPLDCIFSPYFLPNNPQRFTCVHKIYGASNIGKLLEQVPVHLREETVESLYYEAKCRIQDPVYGCVRLISLLNQEIQIAQSQLAKAQAEIAFFNASSFTESSLVKHPGSEQSVFNYVPTTCFNGLVPDEQHSDVALNSSYGVFNFPLQISEAFKLF